MRYKQKAPPCYSSGYAYGTGDETVTVDIPHVPEYVPIIDRIIASTINGTINSTASLRVGSVILSRKFMATATPQYFTQHWGSGFPLWRLSTNQQWSWSEHADVFHATSPPPGQYAILGGTAGSGEDSQAIAQTAVTSLEYTATGVAIWLTKVGTPTDTLTLTVRDTDPTGAAIVTSAAIQAEFIKGIPTLVWFPFPTPTLIASGSALALTLTRSGARDTTNYVYAPATTNSAYALGTAFTRDSNAWNSSATDDIPFRITSHLPVVLTLPTGSTSSYLGVTYHYARPSEVRN